MTPFAIYELKAVAVLALFHLFFRLLLCRKTFHSLNRAHQDDVNLIERRKKTEKRSNNRKTLALTWKASV